MGIEQLAQAMHDAAIRYANGHTVDFQHEAREFVLKHDKAEQEDAAMFRWLVGGFRTCSVDIGGQHSYAPTGPVMRLRGPSFREAIRAAMSNDQGTQL